MIIECPLVFCLFSSFSFKFSSCVFWALQIYFWSLYLCTVNTLRTTCGPTLFQARFVNWLVTCEIIFPTFIVLYWKWIQTHRSSAAEQEPTVIYSHHDFFKIFQLFCIWILRFSVCNDIFYWMLQIVLLMYS